MQLTTEPELVAWPETHYVFVEKTGPFQTSAAQAWQQVHQLTPAVAEHNSIIGYMSLYKTEQQVYRAGLALASAPKDLPEGLGYQRFHGGKYSRFIMTGGYSNLPEASCRLFGIVEEKKIPLRDDFNIENYTNDPRVTPEDQLITEILFPTA